MTDKSVEERLSYLERAVKILRLGENVVEQIVNERLLFHNKKYYYIAWNESEQRLVFPYTSSRGKIFADITEDYMFSSVNEASRMAKSIDGNVLTCKSTNGKHVECLQFYQKDDSPNIIGWIVTVPKAPIEKGRQMLIYNLPSRVLSSWK